ncbi:MAG: hypothetical protein V4722_08900 [Bacteroidota bacterium]
MKTLNIAVLLILALSSCGQSVSPDKQQPSIKSTSQEVLAIYLRMTTEICNCTSTTMKGNRPSTTLDSCYKVVVDKSIDTLIAIGYDSTSEIGRIKLLSEIRLYLCEDLYSLLKKEWADRDANKLLFKGTIVSQKQLSNGEIEIVMVDGKTKVQKKFKSQSFLRDPMQVNKNTLSYEMIIEYEVRHNSEMKQDDYYIKEGGYNGVGTINKVDN